MSDLNDNQKKVLARIKRSKQGVVQRQRFTRKSTQRTGSGNTKAKYNNKTLNSLIKKGYLVLDRKASTKFEKVYKAK